MSAIYQNGVWYCPTGVHSGFTPVGTIISVMGVTAPMNYLACEGQVVNISDYPELALYFETQFGDKNHFGGDGIATFGIPDLRGEFLRGTGTNSHTNQGNGADVGEHQDGTEHNRISFYKVSNTSIQIVGEIDANLKNSTSQTERLSDSLIPSSNTSIRHWTNGAISAKTASASKPTIRYTSNPTNTSVLYCIATKNIFMDAGSNYSTEEQVVGTWIDGKPLYQKSFSGTTGAVNTDEQIGTIENIEQVVNTYGMITRSNGRMDVIPSTANSIAVSSNGIVTVYTTNNNQTNRPIVLTVQYTKTTD